MGIEVKNASKNFDGFAALNDVSINVPDGSLTALLGPSGSGKSTLLRIIAGLETADSGQVLLTGEDVTAQSVQQRGIGFVFQHYAAFKHMTVRENIAFGLRIRKTPRDKIRDRVKELMHLVQLQGMAHRYPSQLSGGQRQRMALARALAVGAQGPAPRRAVRRARRAGPPGAARPGCAASTTRSTSRRSSSRTTRRRRWTSPSRSSS